MDAGSEASFDAFISYSRIDKAWVDRLVAALDREGLRVWLDSAQEVPGTFIAERLERAIQASRAIIFVVSSNSLRSSWVKEEYYAALGLANA